MGIGDELMRAGEARRRAEGSNRRYLMLNKRGEPVWHPVWEGHPNIARPHERFDDVMRMPEGRRDYIADIGLTQYIFKQYSPAAAPIVLPPHSKQLAARTAGAVVFNPTIKPRASPNKDWGLERWTALVAACSDLRWVQLGEPGGPRIRGAEFIPTGAFLDACALLSGARAAVLHEGALHHAAAAVNVPAVVIRGGFISPQVTGYSSQVSMYIEDARYPLGCGMRYACPHCAEAMASITPQRVAEALRKLLAC